MRGTEGLIQPKSFILAFDSSSESCLNLSID